MGTKQVLVADDEYLIRYSLGCILRAAGAEVTAVASAEEALARVGSHFHHLCFLDRRFPGLDGLEALPLLKKASPETRVVFMTAVEPTPAERAVIDRYADCFLGKPFDFHQVRALTERMLGAKRSGEPQG